MSLFHTLVLSASIVAILAASIQTPYGEILGLSSNRTDSYLGIRYGSISARWLPATLSKGWNETLNATTFGPICHQYGPFQQPTPMIESEDCLFLNVWVPNTNDSSLPVRVWFHGGGYTAGYSNDYDGENLAYLSQSIIVTINYRLGVFGFFPLPNLTPYNLGWIDQQLALQWIQENIASFGGDPTNVMIFGQSAGGGSVIAHLIMESSWSLYSSAVLESPGPFRFENCKEKAPINFDLLDKAFPECQADLSCFQKLNASQFYQTLTMNWITLWPCIDEQSQLSAQPITLIRKGFYNKQAKILGGYNYNEGQSTTFLFNQYNISMSSERYHNLAEQYQLPSELINRYDPTTTDKNYFNAFTWLIGDYYCNCPISYFFKHLTSPSIYAYFFVHPSVNWAFSLLNFNATHLTEIAYVFHSHFGGTQFTPAEADLSQKIIDYFTSFHRSESPWPSYKLNQSIIILDIGDKPMQIQHNFNRELLDRCSFVLKYIDSDDCHAYLTDQECSTITHCRWMNNHCDEIPTSSADGIRFSLVIFLFTFLLFENKSR